MRQGADSSSGSIQPHGVLLALDPDTLKVVQVAGEIQGMLGLAPAEILGRGLEARIGPAAIERLRMLAGQNVPIPRPIFVFETVVRRDGKILDAVVHLSDGVLVVELEPRLGESHVNPLTLAQGMITRVQDGTTLPAFLDAIAGEVRALMGFDRVMVYQFEPDDSGVVIAEAKIEALDPFLGLHYPASDIPQQARALYLRNWARLIPDARYTPAPITPTVNPITGRPLDLSFSTLRSVSPLHLEYLGNMGVVASMSLSLVVEGKLWGLIACHHREAKYLPHALRSVCELFAQMMSLQLGEKIAKAEQVDRLRAKRIHGELVEAMVREESVNEALIHNRPNLADYIPSEGVAIWWDGEATLLGHTPTEDQIRALVVWLNDEVPEGVFMTDCLSERFPPASAYSDAASGLIALSVSRQPRDYVLWFRPEIIRTVTWAGNPEKPVQASEGGLRLNPRKSFAAWQEIVQRRSLPWQGVDAEAAQRLRISMLEVVLRRLDEVMREREEARAHKDFLMAELDHRVKNTIATVQSIVRYCSANTDSLDAFTVSIQDRLQAMASAHGMLIENRWEGGELNAIITEQLRPFGVGTRVKVTGPKLMLRPKAALSFSLAMHELATNASKYGALSVPAGWIELDWQAHSKDGERWLTFRWVERGGPPVTPPSRRGFGRLLLERSLAFDVDGKVDLDFRPEGLTCTAIIPFEQIVEQEYEQE